MFATKKYLSLSLLSLFIANAEGHASPKNQAKDLLFPLCVNGECGVVDEQGKVIVPFSGKNLFGIVDLKSVYSFVENGRHGVKDRAGAVLVPPIYDGMNYLDEGLLAVMKGSKWGVITLKGVSLISPEYDDVFYHESAGAFSAKKGDKYFLFDKSGQPFKDVESGRMMEDFHKEEDIKSGFGSWIKVRTTDNEGTYLFNTQTRKKTKVYKDVYRQRGGAVLVQNEKGLRTLISPEGNELFPFKYDSSLGYPNEGLIPFRENGKYGFLDMEGKVAIPAEYDYSGSAGKAGALVGMKVSQSLLYGIIDRRGKWVIEPTLTNAGGGDFLYDNPQVPIAKDGRMGVYDLNTLQWVVAPKYEWASTSGRFIAAGDAPPGYDQEQSWGQTAGKKQAASTKTMGLFNHDGSVLIARKYRMFNSPFAFGADGYTFGWTVKGGKQAVISPEGKEIIGQAWPKYVFFKPGVIVGGLAAEGGQTGEAYYDEAGKLLLHYKTDACGQQQIFTGDQRVVWPLSLKACKRRAMSN